MEYLIWVVLAGFVILPWAWVMRAIGDDRAGNTDPPPQENRRQPAVYPFRKVF